VELRKTSRTISSEGFWETCRFWRVSQQLITGSVNHHIAQHLSALQAVLGC
jgi:hypothetical protein